jgi:hypothetical protein
MGPRSVGTFWWRGKSLGHTWIRTPKHSASSLVTVTIPLRQFSYDKVTYHYWKKENILRSDSNGVRVRAMRRHQKAIAGETEFIGLLSRNT